MVAVILDNGNSSDSSSQVVIADVDGVKVSSANVDSSPTGGVVE
jgi:hypothetical protein